MLPNIKYFISKNPLLIIFFIYFLFISGIFFFSKYINSANFIDGYILGGDSGRYIMGAKNLISNLELPDGKASGYLGYIFFISLFEYFNLNLTYAVIFQIFLTVVSTMCLFKISKKFSSNFGALFSVILYLFYFPIQIRNFYILTETLFICFIIFITYFLVFYKKKYLPILIFLVLYTIFIRPHGILILPCIMLSIVIWSFFNNYKKIIYFFIFFSILLLYPFMLLLNTYLENEQIIDRIINMGIIYGYKSEENFINYNVRRYEKNDLFSLIIFINDNILNFFIAIYKKLYFFFFRVRPYYSEIHNFYLIIYNFIVYPLAIFGFFKFNTKKKLSFYFINTVIIFFTISICLYVVDWSGRFSLYILPLIFIYAGIGINEWRQIKI